MAASKVGPCGICGKGVMANSVLCVKCGKWTHGRCAKTKRVAQSLARDYVHVLDVRREKGKLN